MDRPSAFECNKADELFNSLLEFFIGDSNHGFHQ